MSLYDAVRTLKDGYYSLESSTGLDVEEKLMPPGKFWYLATTRSKAGDYHIQKAHNSGAIFTLDGRWLNQRYETLPVDYYSLMDPVKVRKLKRGEWKTMDPAGKTRMFPSHGEYARGSESEDRVFSKSHAIPLQGSTLSIHVFVIPKDSKNRRSYSDISKSSLNISSHYNDESLEARAAEVKEIIRWGQKRNISVYLYDNKGDWITQQPRKRIDPNSEYGQQLLGNKEYVLKNYERTPSYSAKNWIELIEKNSTTDKLSNEANKLRYNLTYSYRQDTANSFAINVMSNAARDPTSPDYPAVIIINQYMSRNRISNIQELANHLAKKWANYKS
jgi:hypothetical protein